MIFNYRSKEPTQTSGEKPPLLILLHGIGADENDLFGLAPFLDERFFIVSAQAPYQLPYGGYAWFELFIEPGNVSFNAEQFLESRSKIPTFVDELIREHDLDASRVFLCGFSQGAMMALSSVLTVPEKYAGLVAMSGRAATEMLPPEENFEGLKDFPIFVSHGVYDPVLPIDNGRATKEILSRLPVDLEYKEYPMGHEISQESLGDVREWFSKRLGNQ
ncbi:MAG: alpha/beta hydrolase [Pyrinomonadaceae bacterium]|nr:alpha/beta hydrolase [Pyrinomonadaceae bacterium]